MKLATVPPRLDEGSLERLYTELEKPLYNVVFRWVWQREEARDIVQEAFVRLWRMRARVELETVRPLVYRIALNLAARRRRWRRLWRMAGLEAAGERAAAGRGPDEDVMSGEAQRNVRRALDELPAALREVIVLCELGELSYQEVATVMKVPLGTVGSRRNAAMARLKRALEQT